MKIKMSNIKYILNSYQVSDRIAQRGRMLVGKTKWNKAVVCSKHKLCVRLDSLWGVKRMIERQKVESSNLKGWRKF